MPTPVSDDHIWRRQLPAARGLAGDVGPARPVLDSAQGLELHSQADQGGQQ